MGRGARRADPGPGALGHGSPEAFVDGLHNALIAGAGLAAVGAIGTAWLLRAHRAVRSGGAPNRAKLASSRVSKGPSGVAEHDSER